MKRKGKIFVAGHRGLVGSAVIRRLQSAGFTNIVLRTRQQLDLLDQAAVRRFFAEEGIAYVIHAAARVGGIVENNTHQADFLYENLVLATNVLHAAAESGVEKLLYLGSSCVYPKMAEQPIHEGSLLTGALEPTNEGYAIAKIAGLKLCEKYRQQYGKCFISAMPTNLYGPGDNFHPTGSHVIPGLMRRFHEAKVSGAQNVVVWGSGRPRREFLHVDDLAEAIVLLMERYDELETINVGAGKDSTIAELASTMREIVGFEGELVFDSSKPDGTPRKILDVGRIESLGWKATTPLREGLRATYEWALREGVFGGA